MNREEFEKEQLGDRPTSAYEGRTNPDTDNLPAPFDSPSSHERNTTDPAQHEAADEVTREERRREGLGDSSQR